VRSDIYASRVTSDGVLLDPEGFAVANASVPEIHPAVAGNDGVALFVGSLFESPMTSYRIGYRFLGLSAGLPPLVSDIPNQTIPMNGRFLPIRADSYVSDPDNPDTDITWSWTGNTALRISWDAAKRGIRIKSPRNWTGSEVVTFTATDPDGNSDGDDATYTVTAAGTPLPEATSLLENYPNPFNPSTTFEFRLAEQVFVELRVFDLLGREVATLVHEVREAGTHRVSWNASGLASGVYVYRLKAGDFVQTNRLTLMK
jgi:hypothetical protein